MVVLMPVDEKGKYTLAARARFQIARAIGGNVLGVLGMEFFLQLEMTGAYLYSRGQGTD